MERGVVERQWHYQEYFRMYLEHEQVEQFALSLSVCTANVCEFNAPSNSSKI